MELALEYPELKVQDRKALLAEILKRREFARRESSFILMRIISRIIEWLEKLLERLRLDISLSSGFVLSLKLVFYSVLGALFVVIMVLLIRRVVGRVSSPLKPVARETLSTEHWRPGNSQELRKKAQEFAKQGDYRSAVRYLYLSILVYLDEKGEIEYDRTETNSEYLEKVSMDSPLYGGLAILTTVFERCWYGLTALSGEEYSQFRDYYENVLEASK